MLVAVSLDYCANRGLIATISDNLPHLRVRFDDLRRLRVLCRAELHRARFADKKPQQRLSPASCPENVAIIANRSRMQPFPQVNKMGWLELFALRFFDGENGQLVMRFPKVRNFTYPVILPILNSRRIPVCNYSLSVLKRS